MNFSLFISSRITKQHEGSFSRLIHKIAVYSIAFSLAVMVLSILILKGFQVSVADKIFQFTGHYNVTKYSRSASLDQYLSTNQAFLNLEENHKLIREVRPYAYLAGLAKSKEVIQGILFKGVELSQSESIRNFLIEGDFPDTAFSGRYSKEVVISDRMLQKLDAQIGDKILVYFVQNPPRYRKVKISGVYQTGMSDFDDQVVVGDIDLVRRINNWPDTLVSGYELVLHRGLDPDIYHGQMFDLVGYNLYPANIKQRYMQIFDWLNLLPRNVLLLVVIIMIVSCFNMISILLILIMERTRMIGVLRALGTGKAMIRNVFGYNGLLITARGMIIGNALALSLAYIQYTFKVIKLDAKSYYMAYVPIEWDWQGVLIINAVSIAVIYLALRIPTAIIAKINPVDAIKFS